MYPKAPLFSILIYFAFSISTQAQSTNLDSLDIVFQSESSVEGKRTIILDVLDSSKITDSLAQYTVSKWYAQMSREFNDPYYLALSNRRKAIYLNRLNQLDSAIFYYEKTIDLLHPQYVKVQNGDFSDVNRMRSLAKAYSNKGYVHAKKGETKQAIELYESALDLASEIEAIDVQLEAYSILGYLYSQSLEDEKAFDCYMKALKLVEGKDKMTGSDLLIYFSLFEHHFGKGNYSKAQEYLDKAMEKNKVLVNDEAYEMQQLQILQRKIRLLIKTDKITEAQKDAVEYEAIARKRKEHHSLVRVLTRLADALIEKKDYIAAEGYISKAENLENIMKVEGSAVNIFSSKSKLAMAVGQYNKAKSILTAQIDNLLDSKQINYQNLLELYRLRSIAYKETNNHKTAYTDLVNYYQIRDSLNNEERLRFQTETEEKYETQKKENEIIKLKASDFENNAKISRQRNLLTSSIGGISLLGLLAFSLFRNNRSEKKANALLQQKNEIIQTKSNQNKTLLKEIHHRVKNNLQTISSLLYLQSANINDEDAKEAIAQGQHRVESMALIHKNLYQRDNLAGIEMKDYISRLVKNLKDAYTSSSQNVDIRLDMDETDLDVDTAIPLGLIINELLTNVFKYAFPERENGNVTIAFRKQGEEGFHLKIKDNGIGNHNKPSGFGSQLIQLLTKQLDATFTDGNDNGYWCQISNIKAK